MLSKAKTKWIHSLELKKFRSEYRLFTAEGNKLAEELLPLLPCRFLAATPEWLEAHPGVQAEEIVEASYDELRRACTQASPQGVIAVFHQPDYPLDMARLSQTLSLALDNVQDPGNLGTILRTADWFGIEHVLCSPGTADAFQPKAIQSTMGAIGRVQVHYVDLEEVFEKSGLPVFGTFLEGEDIYEAELPGRGIILMGNEGKGISPRLAAKVSRKLFIPNFPAGRKGPESLNVSVATAIVCSEFLRRKSRTAL